jgi:enoyl-CoA hydratase/carnithine racemase
MRAMQLAELIAANAPLGVQATKAAARVFVDQGEAAAIAVIPDLRRTVMESEDAKEGMRSVLQRRHAAFAGR